MKRVAEDLKKGALARVYLFFGEETYLRQHYKEKMIRAAAGGEGSMNLNIHRGKNPPASDLISEAQTLPFFAETRLVLAEDTGWFAPGADADSVDLMIAFLKEIPETTVLLFCEESVDKRSRLYKAVAKAGRAAEFAYQTEETLRRWVMARLKEQGVSITGEALQEFLERTGDDMTRIDAELSKLLAYTVGTPGIRREDVQAVCSVRPENRIFDMIDAISAGDRKKALDLYEDLLALREAPQKILVLLERQYRMLLQVKSMQEMNWGRAQMSEQSGIRDFVLRKCLKQTDRLSERSLRAAVEACADADERIKTGRADERVALEMLLMQLTAPK